MMHRPIQYFRELIAQDCRAARIPQIRPIGNHSVLLNVRGNRGLQWMIRHLLPMVRPAHQSSWQAHRKSGQARGIPDGDGIQSPALDAGFQNVYILDIVTSDQYLFHWFVTRAAMPRLKSIFRLPFTR